MRLKYGSYLFPDKAVGVTFHKDYEWNEGDQALAQKIRADIDGHLYADTQADLTTAIALLELALAQPYRDLAFYDDSSALSAIVLLNRSSTTGVRLVAGPHYPDGSGADYTNRRRFTCSFEATYPLAASKTLLVSFQEQVAIAGGGPVFVIRRCLDAPPQRQLVYRQTEYRATQSGTIVGYQTWPALPTPLWPQALKQAPEVTRHAPKRAGGQPKYTHFRVDYRYEFESVTPLTFNPAIPTRWV